MPLLIIIYNLFSYGGKKCQILSKKIQMLARNLLCEVCAKLIDFLKKIIFSENFLSSNKQSPKNFIRNRILPFHNIIFFLMNLIKGSYQDELDYFSRPLTIQKPLFGKSPRVPSAKPEKNSNQKPSPS